MRKLSCTIWFQSSSRATLSRTKLRKFAFRLRARRRILVFFQTQIPKEHAKQIKRYQRLGLIEVFQVDGLAGFYSETDFQIAIQTQFLAKYIVSKIAPSMLSKSGFSFDRIDISNMSAGLELQLADNLYSRIRQFLAIFDECKVDKNDLWEDFGNSLLTNLNAQSLWYPGRYQEWPAHVNLVAKEPNFFRPDIETSGFGHFPDSRPQTLLLGNPGQPTYLRSAEAIGYAELKMGKRFDAIFEVRHPNKIAPLHWGDEFVCHSSEFYLNSPEPALGDAKLRLALPEQNTCKTVHAQLSKSDPLLVQRFGFNPENWFALLLNETLAATNSRLPRIAGFYYCLMNHPQFQNIETLVCSPSRSAVFVPVALGLKLKGVKTIEYQAFFWSAHPRYQVLDMDLFVCSDAATKKVIEEKIDRVSHETKVVLGPSFGMANFMKDYAVSLSKEPEEKSPKPIGIALQPINDKEFEAACRLIRDAGYDILCRPHPRLDRAQVKAQFGRYGQIDDGTLVDFIRNTSLVVTGFSNVALQTALVGKTAVCLPVPNLLGLNLSDASQHIHLCNDLEDLHRFLGTSEHINETPGFHDPISHWCEIRRAETPDQISTFQANG